MLKQVENRCSTHPLRNCELAGLDRVVRTEDARHHIVSVGGTRDRASSRQLSHDRAEARPFLDGDRLRTGFRTRSPPQQIKRNERGEDQTRRGNQKPPHTAFMISDALVPPKPKLLLSTARTRRFLALCGTRSTPSVPSSGSSRLRVGGTIWSRIARMQKIASTAPAPPSK